MQKASPSSGSLLPLPSLGRTEMPRPQHPQCSRGGGNRHQLQPGTPAALAGMGRPWHVRASGFAPIHPTPPCPSPTLPLVQPPHTQAGGAGTPPRTPGCVPPPCPPSRLPGCRHQHPSAAGPLHSLVRSWHHSTTSTGHTCAGCHHAVPQPLQPRRSSPRQQQIHLLKKQGVALQALGAVRSGLCRDGLCCASVEPFPLPAPCAINLLLQMANFENPLIRIRSSTSIFIYFPFS